MKQNHKKVDFEESNLFQEIGELVLIPFDSVGNVVSAIMEGEIPEKKDITIITGALASLFVIYKIF